MDTWSVPSLGLGGLRLPADPEKPNPVTLIWLHGLGASAYDFLEVAQQFQQRSSRSVKVILPDAPRRPVTVNGGMVMPAWFDWVNPQDPWEGTEPTREDSFRKLSMWVEMERAEFPQNELVMGGFSQGGAISLETGLRLRPAPAAIFGLSCWCLRKDASDRKAAYGAEQRRIFLGHGTEDPLLPLSAGEWTARALSEDGHEVSWNTYPMPHSVSAEELEDLFRWLNLA